MLLRAFLAMALATPVISSAQEASEPNTVAGVAVTGGQPPIVTSTFPTPDSEVSPGVLVVKIVFDQPMKPDDWSFAPTADAEMPDCLPTPRLLGDRKTFVLLCSTLGGKIYAMTVNPAGPHGFVSAGERRAGPAELRFTTVAGEPVRTIRQAMKTAGLGELDMPVEGQMTYRQAAATP
jgi:hypothetical protein